jgi:hypothetical protein
MINDHRGTSGKPGYLYVTTIRSLADKLYDKYVKKLYIGYSYMLSQDSADVSPPLGRYLLIVIPFSGSWFPLSIRVYIYLWGSRGGQNFPHLKTI